jgi:hypothetical protein
MLALKVLETDVSCRLSNMRLTGAMLSLNNRAQYSAISFKLRQSLASDILHESMQCQNIISIALPHVRHKPMFLAFLSFLTHQPNNSR